jgi:hypothetical protein
VLARLVGIFPEPANFLTVLIMRQTQVTAPDFAPVPAPTSVWAAIRFVASVGALIGVSLPLASV